MPWRGDSTQDARRRHSLNAHLAYTGVVDGIHGNENSFTASFIGTFHDTNPCHTTPTDPAALALVAAVASNWQCYDENIRDGAVPTPGRDGGAGQVDPPGPGGGTGPTAPPGTFIPGCPLTGALNAGCDWHLAREGIPAIDINCTGEHNLLSTCAGTVIAHSFDTPGTGPDGLISGGGLGVLITVQCDSGLIVRYGHTDQGDLGLTPCADDGTPSNCIPFAGTRVVTNQVVGHCGVPTTGRSSGPHLHLEVFNGGSRICPLDVLPPQCP